MKQDETVRFSILTVRIKITTLYCAIRLGQFFNIFFVSDGDGDGDIDFLDTNKWKNINMPRDQESPFDYDVLVDRELLKKIFDS